MSGLLHTSGPTAFGATTFGGRNYDYTKIYRPDKPGDGIEDNARIWNVYLDEAEDYDADMIQAFRNIIDSLLVFASLFSAVVTTFVAQTSQALQPDKSQAIIALLFENNQLLRAAGNRTSISNVPTTSPQNQTYTSIDVWVNGFFFTSLALSLATALLSVLAKQWIQAYTAIVPGSAKTRALIRHFRFQGLTKWKLGEIVESLPLILHSSVALFLVGLALYVSQLSRPICGVVSAITTLTFLFYFGTSCLPALYIICPYRIPFMFSLAQLPLFAFRVARCALLHLRSKLTEGITDIPWPEMSKQSLKAAESSKVFCYKDHALLWETGRLACDSLDWLFNLSSNHSVKNVVLEGACFLLNEWNTNKYLDPFRQLISCSESNDLFFNTVKYSLSQLSDTPSTSITEETLKQSTCANLIENFIKISPSKSLLNGPFTGLRKDWQQELEYALSVGYDTAIKKRYRALSRCILDWGHPGMMLPESRCGRNTLISCATEGDGEAIRDLVDRGMDPKHWRDGDNGYTILHWAARAGNLKSVKALVQRVSSLVSVQAPFLYDYLEICTPLDLAIHGGHPDVVAYLLDAGAKPPTNALHITVSSWDLILSPTKRLTMVEFLLDRGWDRTIKDADGRMPVDIARSMGFHTIVEHLENYQTELSRPLVPGNARGFKSRLSVMYNFRGSLLLYTK